tara:strand:- start:11711 stop:13063 length:1353 start_codon:yes stop_codon:yes gene_type:complete
MEENGIFNPDDTASEVQRLKKAPSASIWSPKIGSDFELIIPETVYPPREDTDLMAKRLIAFGPGKGRRFLEIGCGSGALCVLASALGWKVSGCDVNPYAVAATKGNLEINRQEGFVKEGGVGPDKFPFDGKYDLIIWNLPYIPVSEVTAVLGPMEEAALIDSDADGLAQRMIRCITNNQLLATNGRILILGRENSIREKGNFAMRKWDHLEFDDGEKLSLFCLWRPFENARNRYVESTGSTNDDLMNSTGIGTHISTSWQHSGKGRRNRTWTSIEGCYAGSWIIAESDDINPGLLQLSGGLAVLNSIDDKRLKIKWPNDILIEDRKLCGILVEGKTINDHTKAILGIGINLRNGTNIEGLQIASLDEIIDISHEEIDLRLNRELSSLLEEGENLPPVDYEMIRDEVTSYMKLHGKPVHGGTVYNSFQLNEKGELLLDKKIIDDGEDVEWI